MPSDPIQEAFFLPRDAPGHGQRFAIHHRPADGPIRGAMVYVHPFAEEMNKSRRMAALQSRALARAGFAVLQIDLYGCGDSSGDLADAAWDDWVADVVNASRWLGERHGSPVDLWGLRAGCLVAATAARQLDSPSNVLFWQPAHSGTVVLQQFLRLKVAAGLLDGRAKTAMEAMRAELAAGRPIEVAGYTISAALADGLLHCTLEPPSRAGRVLWVEVTQRSDATLLPASIATADRWTQAGYTVVSNAVKGPAFWQTVEIEDAPELISATLAMVTGAVTE